MRNFLFANGGWLLRAITVTVLVAVISLSLLPRLTSHISTSATVNARVMVIRSPIEGIVEEYRLITGAPVVRGQSLVTFREADTDLTQLTDLQARLRIARAAEAAVARRIAEVETLRLDLARRQTVDASWHAGILLTEIEEIEAQIRGAQARLEILDHDARRAARLRESGAMSEADLTVAANRFREQVARVTELEARREGRQLMLRALSDGVIAGTNGTNTPYTQQRRDEIGLELALLGDELADRQAEQAAILEQIEREREIYEQENRVTLASPVTGVVWRSASLAGRPVLPGDEVVELLDCSSRFLEAYLSERLMDNIALGDIAEVRMTGEARVFRAPVISIIGTEAQFDHADLAARDTAPRAGKMRVLIEIDAASLDLDANRFCHVGRTAQVSLPRDLPRVEKVFARLGATFDVVAGWWSTATGRLGLG